MTDVEPAPSQNPFELVREAKALCDDGDFERAIGLADRALAIDPANVEAMVARGWALENLDRLGEARIAYEASLALDPDRMPALEGLGNVLHRLGEPEQAAARFRAAVQAAAAFDDPDAATLELAGWCQYRLGHHAEAAHAFRTALTLEPKRVAARFDLALTLLVGGHGVRALGEFERALHEITGWPAARRRGVIQVALFDLREAESEDPGLAASPELARSIELLEAALSARD